MVNMSQLYKKEHGGIKPYTDKEVGQINGMNLVTGIENTFK